MCELCDRISHIGGIVIYQADKIAKLETQLSKAHYFLEQMSPDTYKKYRGEEKRSNKHPAEHPLEEEPNSEPDFPNMSTHTDKTTGHNAISGFVDIGKSNPPEEGVLKFKDLKAPDHVKKQVANYIKSELKLQGITVTDQAIGEQEIDCTVLTMGPDNK